MRYLKEIKLESIEEILWIDIETASIEKEITEDSIYWNAWEQKTRWDDKLENIDDIANRYKERAPIYKEFGKIVSISYGYIVQDELKVKELALDNEKELLEEFLKDYEIFVAGGKRFIGGFSILQFDIPFISFRCMVHDITLPFGFDTAGIAPWNIKNVVDVQNLLKGTSMTSISLQGACAAFGLPSSKDVLSGNKVNELYWSEDPQRLVSIVEYASEDNLAACNLLCRLLQEPLKTLSKAGKKIEVKELPLLERLYKENAFTPDIKEGLEKLLKKKKYSKKDKESIKEILFAVYARNNFETNDQDSKKVLAEKEQEINNFLETLINE